MASKKEVAYLLDNINPKMKAIIETQSVLRDGINDMRRCLKVILDRIEELEATSEVVKLSLKRKIDIEHLGHLEKKIVDIEKKVASPFVKHL